MGSSISEYRDETELVDCWEVFTIATSSSLESGKDEDELIRLAG